MYPSIGTGFLDPSVLQGPTNHLVDDGPLYEQQHPVESYVLPFETCQFTAPKSC
jgi:hypothetical protein